MKIAYVLPTFFSGSTKRNGIKMQAILWGEALEKRGHVVDYITPWKDYDWSSYDAIHVFGCGAFDFVNNIYKKGVNRIVLSPIIDTIQSTFAYRLASFWGSSKLRLESPNFTFRKSRKQIAQYCVRSNYEASYVEKAYSVDKQNISIVPLSYRLSDIDVDLNSKENFCFHISTLSQDRKNVMRLIRAAIKYKFNLVLAGSPGSKKSFAPFEKLINENENIKYLGIISDDELINLYKKAKVFALPSICEGVGMVALDAAMFGCEIVITNIGGPQEYYADLAYRVNPYSVDEIGNAIIKALNNNKQPQLKHHIERMYNFDVCIDKLEDMYKAL